MHQQKSQQEIENKEMEVKKMSEFNKILEQKCKMSEEQAEKQKKEQYQSVITTYTEKIT